MAASSRGLMSVYEQWWTWDLEDWLEPGSSQRRGEQFDEAVADSALDHIGDLNVSIRSRDWPTTWRSAAEPHC
jgi:hypothetical protein